MSNMQERIYEAMDAKGMSQAELSRLSGVSKSSLSRYLGGDEMPASKLAAIADALRVSVDYLLGIPSPPLPEFPLSPDELRLLDLYRAMEPDYRAMLMKTAVAYAAMSEKDSAGVGEPAALGAVR